MNACFNFWTGLLFVSEYFPMHNWGIRTSSDEFLQSESSSKSGQEVYASKRTEFVLVNQHI